MLELQVQPVGKNIVCKALLPDDVPDSTIERSALRILRDNLALDNCVLRKIGPCHYTVHELSEAKAYVYIVEGD